MILLFFLGQKDNVNPSLEMESAIQVTSPSTTELISSAAKQIPRNADDEESTSLLQDTASIDIKPVVPSGTSNATNLEEQMLKFLEGVQLSARSMESFLKKAALQIENLIKRCAAQERLGFQIFVDKLDDGNWLGDILIGESFSLSKLIKPESGEIFTRSDATKKFLRFCSSISHSLKRVVQTFSVKKFLKI